MWRGQPHPKTTLDWLAQAAMATWVLPLPPMLAGLVGLLMHPRRSRALESEPVRNVVCFRIVSRGDNAGVLRESVANTVAQMHTLPLFPYVVEVVTDRPVAWPAGPRVHFMHVPAQYQTPNESRFKARALEYALRHSPLPPDAWIVHFDEETQLTLSGIVGIRDAIAEEEASGRHRIGQGAILYHRSFGAGSKGLLLSLADMIRTGDDLGRFHLQHRVGLALFGLHGSFIVVRNSVEQAVGFDFGPRGSITEDAFWAMAEMARGHRCRWVEGYLAEQPPARVRDFLKQRRRWLWGLFLVLRHAPAPLWMKLALGVCVMGWALSALGVIIVYGDLAVGQVAYWPVRLSGDITMVLFGATYVVGLRENLMHMSVPRLQRWLLYVVEVLLLPLFALLEACAVLYGLLTRGGKGFHVISKPAREAATATPLPATPGSQP